MMSTFGRSFNKLTPNIINTSSNQFNIKFIRNQEQIKKKMRLYSQKRQKLVITSTKSKSLDPGLEVAKCLQNGPNFVSVLNKLKITQTQSKQFKIQQQKSKKLKKQIQVKQQHSQLLRKAIQSQKTRPKLKLNLQNNQFIMPTSPQIQLSQTIKINRLDIKKSLTKKNIKSQFKIKHSDIQRQILFITTQIVEHLKHVLFKQNIQMNECPQRVIQTLCIYFISLLFQKKVNISFDKIKQFLKYKIRKFDKYKHLKRIQNNIFVHSVHKAKQNQLQRSLMKQKRQSYDIDLESHSKNQFHQRKKHSFMQINQKTCDIPQYFNQDIEDYQSIDQLLQNENKQNTNEQQKSQYAYRNLHRLQRLSFIKEQNKSLQKSKNQQLFMKKPLFKQRKVNQLQVNYLQVNQRKVNQLQVNQLQVNQRKVNQLQVNQRKVNQLQINQIQRNQNHHLTTISKVSSININNFNYKQQDIIKSKIKCKQIERNIDKIILKKQDLLKSQNLLNKKIQQKQQYLLFIQQKIFDVKNQIKAYQSWKFQAKLFIQSSQCLQGTKRIIMKKRQMQKNLKDLITVQIWNGKTLQKFSSYQNIIKTKQNAIDSWNNLNKKLKHVNSLEQRQSLMIQLRQILFNSLSNYSQIIQQFQQKTSNAKINYSNIINVLNQWQQVHSGRQNVAKNCFSSYATAYLKIQSYMRYLPKCLALIQKSLIKYQKTIQLQSKQRSLHIDSDNLLKTVQELYKQTKSMNKEFAKQKNITNILEQII